MKLVERKIIVKFPQYSYWVHIIVSNDLIASRKKRSKELGYDYNPQSDDKYICGMHSYKEGEPNGYIFLNPKISDEGTIAHEAYHAVYRMFTSIGEDNPGEEIYAYTLGYLVEQIHKLIKKK